MNKIVYLHELDSVLTYENPTPGAVLMTPGVKAVFSEIIKNGNIVAISMNQLTDSQLIKEALSDTIAYESLLRLFELGALRVSLFGSVRTPSQYIQNAIKKCTGVKTKFIFSNLPIPENDDKLLEVVYKALKYSDLTIITEEGKKRNADLEQIYRFVNMILQTSVCETSNIPAKAVTENKTSKKNYYLCKINFESVYNEDNKPNKRKDRITADLYGNVPDIIYHIKNTYKSFQKKSDDEKNTPTPYIDHNLPINDNEENLLNETIKALETETRDLNKIFVPTSTTDKEKLETINNFIIETHSNKEPEYYVEKYSFPYFLDKVTTIVNNYDTKNEVYNETITSAVQIIENIEKNIPPKDRKNRSDIWFKTPANAKEEFANEIMNLAYNYTVESSVSIVAKHCNDYNDATFDKDVLNRINLYFFKKQTKKMRVVTPKEWTMLVRFAEYAYKKRMKKQPQKGLTIYENNHIIDKIKWTLYILQELAISSVAAFAYAGIFIILEWLLSFLENYIGLFFKTTFYHTILNIIIMGLLSSGFNVALKKINKNTDIPDILESVQNVLMHIWDLIITLGGKYDSYKLP